MYCSLGKFTVIKISAGGVTQQKYDTQTYWINGEDKLLSTLMLMFISTVEWDGCSLSRVNKSI